MNPHELWNLITRQLTDVAGDAVNRVVPQLPQLGREPSVAGTVLEGRLLTAVDRLPRGNSLVELILEIVGDLETGSPVRLHGWQRAPGSPLGVALVVADPGGHAVLAVTPGGPLIDIVVTTGASLSVQRATGPWAIQATIAAPNGWDAASGPGLPPAPPGGSATITLVRTGHLQTGMTDGPGLSVGGVAITVTATPAAPTSVDVELRELRAAILPAPLARLVGAGQSTPMAASEAGSVTIAATADRASGLRFARTGTVRAELPLRVDVPGVRTRGAAVELSSEGGELRLSFSLSIAANLPGLPLRAALDRAGFDLPVALSAETVGIDPKRMRELFPDGIGTELALPPVSGGGVVRRTSDDGYAGLISIDLGFIQLQAFALFRPPIAGAPTSFLVMLAAQFPPPGVQLGLGFALDAVGGLVGVNRRVDLTALQRLVCDGNADRVLFPDRAVERAVEIVGALSSAFPVGTGRLLIGPMVRITWGGRGWVSLSGALVLELPAPVQAVLVGRLLVSLPDPAVPLIRLQASVLGRVDPSVPVVELLVSLTGSWIVGLAVRGEIYLLVRGGAQPEFVLSAGGFHPRYMRPAGVPALRRLQIDLAPGGGFGLRIEAYLAVTSNAVQFGGQVQLEAMIAGCGVEGWLGLDALFIFEPHFAFAVHVRAGVAVRAFGRRLASVSLDFTLEGPAPWRAFGTGSISVLFWDVELDFDVRWGAPATGGQVGGRDPAVPLLAAIARPEAWIAERPQAERTGLVFTPEATRKLAKGKLVHPDATLRVSQAVLPLGVPISRFERRPVPVQEWTIREVTIDSRKLKKPLPSLPERFVPGEFFDLTEDQQLTERAFITRAGGVRTGTDGIELGPGHRVDDGYETGYEPPPASPQREFTPWPGLFRIESIFAVAAAERLERWRTHEVAVRLRGASLSVVAASDLKPLARDVSLVTATTDAWEAMRDRLVDSGAEVQLVESWEVPA